MNSASPGLAIRDVNSLWEGREQALQRAGWWGAGGSWLKYILGAPWIRKQEAEKE